LLDNLEVVSPLHFSRENQSMGIISIVNPALIKNVEFITGGFPAAYGDKMSSIFKINLKEGNRTQFNHDINLNMGGFNAQLDGPVPGNGSMILTARRGIFDIFTQMMDRPVLPRYWDMVGKLTFQPGLNHKISLVGFYYRDDAERTDTMQDHGELARNYKYAKWDDFGSAIGLNWRYLFANKGYTLTTFEFTRNGRESAIGDSEKLIRNGDDNTENAFRIKSELTYKFSRQVESKIGFFTQAIDPNQHRWRESDTLQTGYIIPGYDYEYEMPTTYKAGAFIQNTLQPIIRLSINAGLRYDYFEYTDESKYSPRLGLVYYVTDKTTLNAAYGHFYQTPSIYQLSLDPANQVLKTARAIHYIIGIEHLLNPDTKISLEAYYKDLDNTFAANDTNRIITNNGSGYARGLEFNVQKKMSKNFVGSMSYTWSISKRRDAPGLQEYDFDYDRRHNLTLVTGYKFSNNWRVGIKFQYATGNPFTPIIGSVKLEDEWFVVEGVENSARYPDFHKLDIRFDRQFRFTNWTLNVYLDMWNIYNNKNILSYYYDVDATGQVTKNSRDDFPFLPILGLNVQF
jgi:outer membrane receptor protein involved in Fe transport